MATKFHRRIRSNRLYPLRGCVDCGHHFESRSYRSRCPECKSERTTLAVCVPSEDEINIICEAIREKWTVKRWSDSFIPMAMQEYAMPIISRSKVDRTGDTPAWRTDNPYWMTEFSSP